MEAFLGKWESTPEGRTGVEEFTAALGVKDKTDRSLKKHFTEFRLEGDMITTINQTEGGNAASQTAKLGERTEMELAGGRGKGFILIKFENGELVSSLETEKGTVHYKTRLEGDFLITESTVQGVTMSAKFTKC